MNKPKAYLMVGIPGSGKSTWVKENLPQNINVISRDIIRHDLGYTKGVDDNAVLDKNGEARVTAEQNHRIYKCLTRGEDVVIDDMNTGKYRKDMIERLRHYGANVIGVRMNTPLETCIKRRNGQIPSEIMEQIYNKVRELKDEEVDSIIDVPDNTNEEV